MLSKDFCSVPSTKVRNVTAKYNPSFRKHDVFFSSGLHVHWQTYVCIHIDIDYNRSWARVTKKKLIKYYIGRGWSQNSFTCFSSYLKWMIVYLGLEKMRWWVKKEAYEHRLSDGPCNFQALQFLSTSIKIILREEADKSCDLN